MLAPAGAPRAVLVMGSPSQVALFLGGFFVAMAMQKWNLHVRIALATVLRVGTDPRRLLFSMMATTWFLSMWM